MGENSKIEWTDHTFNPWIGCTKLADGCKHCYAETLSRRTGNAQWGPEGTRVVTSDAYWKKPLKWNREAESSGKRARVFCASLADVFEDWNKPIQTNTGETLHKCYCGHIDAINPADGFWEKGQSASGADLYECGKCGRRGELKLAAMDDVRQRLFKLIDQTPNLDWLLLTKRPENIGRMTHGAQSKLSTALTAPKGSPEADLWHYPNLWLGTSISNQKDADTNVPRLLQHGRHAKRLFLSVEPLTEEISITKAVDGLVKHEEGLGIDWVIVGGESGPGARPMKADWVRSIRDECQATETHFFFKQWGGVNKASTGRELDGETYSEIPAYPTA